MNPTTRRHPASARTPAHRQSLRRRGRVQAYATAGILGAAGIAAVLFGSSLTASAAPAQSARGAAGSPAHSMLHATFTDSAVSVTPGLGMVELILTGTGTVEGFGAGTDGVGVVEDRGAPACGPGGGGRAVFGDADDVGG